MNREEVFRAASKCTSDDLKTWIFRLERQESELGAKSISDTAALGEYIGVRKSLVILRDILKARKHFE
jgi:hypothetical protein